MQFNSPILYKCICEIRFKPKFVYLSKRLSICDEFKSKLPSWNIDMGKVELHDLKGKKEEDRKSIFVFTNKGASLETSNVGVYENFKSLASFIFSKVTEGLELSALDRIGIRSFSIFESDLSFLDLRNLLYEKLYNDEPKKRKIFGDITDIAVILNTAKDGYDLHTETGPVKKGEIKGRFGFEKQNTPDASILIDIDCFKKDAQARHIGGMLNKYNALIQDMHNDFLGYLKEGK